MQNFARLIFQAAQYLGGIVFRLSIMKGIILVFMMASLSRAIEWDNGATLSATCDNTTMYVKINFTHVFRGTVYQSKNFFYPKCSYTVPIDLNVTEVDLPLHLTACEIDIEEVGNKTTASTEVAIQMHSLLDSVYDRTANVSCEIANYYMNHTETEYNPYSGQGLEHTWIELKSGYVLFGEVGDPIESSLFLVVGIRDDGSNKDMVVQNCIAHTDKNVTNSTSILQLSNFYGCTDPSASLTNFTVVRPEHRQISMYAYAPLSNFNLFSPTGSMFVTCGLTICASTCPAHCNDTEPLFRLPLSDYATKDIISRSGGSVMPGTLYDLNRNNDRFRRVVKRSVGSFLSRFFRLESRAVTGVVSEGNNTNITSIAVSRRVERGSFVSANKAPMKNDFVEEDECCIDWETFRFVALMVICMFITVLSCFCCYKDEVSKKEKRGLV